MGIVAFSDKSQTSDYEALKLDYHQRSPLSTLFIKENLSIKNNIDSNWYKDKLRSL